MTMKVGIDHITDRVLTRSCKTVLIEVVLL